MPCENIANFKLKGENWHLVCICGWETYFLSWLNLLHGSFGDDVILDNMPRDPECWRWSSHHESLFHVRQKNVTNPRKIHINFWGLNTTCNGPYNMFWHNINNNYKCIFNDYTISQTQRKKPNGSTNRSVRIYKEIIIFAFYIGSTMSTISIIIDHRSYKIFFQALPEQQTI